MEDRALNRRRASGLDLADVEAIRLLEGV